MTYHDQSDDYRPLFWLSGRPIYVNTLVLILHVLAFALTGLAMAALSEGVISALALNNYKVVYPPKSGALFSYVIFPPDNANDAIQFIFAMGFLFYFGRGVEEYRGAQNIYQPLLSLGADPGITLHRAGFVWNLGQLHGRLRHDFWSLYRLCDSLPWRGNQHLVRQSHRQMVGHCPGSVLSLVIFGPPWRSARFGAMRSSDISACG